MCMGILMYVVPEKGLEPLSLAACDFESHVYAIPPLRRMSRRCVQRVSQSVKSYKQGRDILLLTSTLAYNTPYVSILRRFYFLD